MNCLNRVPLSLLKHKVKTILLIVAFALIATLLFCGLSINTAVTAVENNAMQNFGSEVKVEYDRTKMVNNTYQFIPATTLKQLDSLSHIKACNHVTYYTVWYKNIKLPVLNGSLLSVVCTTDSSMLDEFATKSYQLVSGRPITKSDEGAHVTIISQALANINHLHINDTITLLGVGDKNIEVKYRIVGIFKPSENFSKGADNNIDFSSDTIYADYNSAAPLFSNPVHNFQVDPASATAAYYLIDSPANVASFIAAAKKIPGMENYAVTSDTTLYDRVTSSLKLAVTLVTLIIGILLAAGCFIFAFIIALSLRGRRREFGILLAVGEKKSRILIQLFLETLIPIIIAFCLGVFASGFVSQSICNKIISNSNMSIQQQDQENWSDASYILSGASKHLVQGEFVSDTAVPIENLTISITPAVFAKFAGCGLLIALFSILFPISRLLRLSPMAILEKKE